MTVENKPPFPPYIFRVGVSGHRPNRLRQSDPVVLAQQIERVLSTVQKAVAECAAAPDGSVGSVRVLSSLAEGADRLVAQAALELGCTLQTVLPMPREDYEADFEQMPSKQEFRALLDRADAVFELDSPTGERAKAYRAAGEITLEQCDLLLVIWDGEPGAGIGGTPELIDRAVALGHPVLRIDARAPHALSFGAAAEPLTAVTALVRSMLLTPPAAQPFAETYRQEVWPRRNALTSYGFVRLFSEGRWRFAPRPNLEKPVVEIEHPKLRPFFRWADGLATHYGEQSRSAALKIQLLASTSVVSGLLTIPFEENLAVLRILSSIELATTLLLVLDGLRLARKPWHGRWLLYRSLAEQIRSLDLLAPLAQTIAASSSSGVYSEADGGSLFAVHHVNAIVRAIGLPNARVHGAFVAERSSRLAKVVGEQAGFQAASAERYEALETVLSRFGLALFAAACVLAFYDVAKSFGFTHFNSPWTTTCSALLPALGAAFASIAAQGEYKRLASRSRGMYATLTSMMQTSLGMEAVSYAAVVGETRRVCEVLMSEVRDWQVLVSIRKPSLPT